MFGCRLLLRWFSKLSTGARMPHAHCVALCAQCEGLVQPRESSQELANHVCFKRQGWDKDVESLIQLHTGYIHTDMSHGPWAAHVCNWYVARSDRIWYHAYGPEAHKMTTPGS